MMQTPTGAVAETWGETSGTTGRTETLSASDRKKRYRQDIAAMKSERATFDPVYRDLSGWVKPSRARFLSSDVNRGDRRWSKIIDATGTFAARTLASGMMAGVTSPARPWFRLTIKDYELAEWGAVRIWLDEVRDMILAMFGGSNLYKTLPTLYSDMGIFATGAMAVFENPDTRMRCFDYPIGSFLIANDASGQVRTFAREYRMTVRQVVEQFGTNDRRGRPDWSKFSNTVKTLYDRGDYQAWVDVTHIITPNEYADERRIESKYKPFASCYFETANADDRYLEEKGFDEFPIFAPRWEVAGEDVYGTESPGMIALGDIKSLQLMEKKGLKAIDKQVDPPMVAQPGMRAAKLTMLPGEVSYVQDPDGKGLRKLHDVNLNLADLGVKQQEARYRIQRAFHEDLFLMLDQLDRKQITATEVLERKQEKLLVLGPVLEQLNSDLLKPLIDRAFAILHRAGVLPPAPQELEGQELDVEYVSIMAQAQKETGLGALDRLTGFVTNFVTQTKDTAILDKVNMDQVVDEYAEMTGVPARVIVSDDEVARVRSARAQQQQAAQAAATAKDAASAAQTLSATDTTSKNALTDLLGASPSGAAA